MPPHSLRSALIGFALLVLIGVTPATGQILPSYVMRGIDSALGAINMNRSDLSMRYDVAGLDSHRLSVISRLFGDPLSSFSFADSLASIGLAGEKNYSTFFNYLGRQLDLGDQPFQISRPEMSDNEIRLYSKIDVNALNFTSALILRRFLTLALATDATITSYRGTIQAERLKRLVAYCDSLIIQSEDDGNATLVEMKEAERYSLARSKQFFNVDAAGLEYERLIEPGVNLSSVALDMARRMQGEIPRYRDSVKTQIWNTPLGLVALGGAGDDIYTGDFFCIVDIGGNDIYRATPRTKATALDHPVSLIIDFSGDDIYEGGDFTFGGTLFGASAVIDMKGDDSYTGRNFSLGCGFFGTGIIYDAEGSDRYSGGTCVEGAGLFGIGLVIDAKGNDTYRAHLQSQGFGYTRGVGAIIENEGNDIYLAASPYTDFLRYDDHFETFCQGAALGSRPVASAGIGIIAEGAGNDSYVADIFGQGTGYWFGLGAIVDKKGNDNYNAFQYAQGSGVHLAFGVLIDSSGSDNYVSHGVSQGCGHDIAFGGLFDANGDDNYVVESLSLGGGNADAISLFVDGGGEDGYIARRTNTLGYSDLRREYGMIGIFLDVEGKDFYGTIRGGNDSLWTGSYYGAGLDANLRPKSPDAPETAAGPGKSKEAIDAELGKDIPTLFVQASAAPQKYQYLVPPAQQRLVDRADESIPYLLSQLNTESPREALALGIVLPKIGKKVAQRLIDTVRHGELSRVGQAIYALGEMHDTSAGTALGERIVDPTVSWRLRRTAGEALLKMSAQSAKPYLIRALRDTFEIVRGYAAHALVLMADSAELTQVLPLLNDRSQIVRYQTQLGLQKRGIDSIANSYANALIETPTGFGHDLLYALATTLKDTAAHGRIVSGMLKNTDPNIRAQGARLALAWNDTTSLEAASEFKKSERNSMVLFELNKIPDMPKRKKSKKKKKEDQAVEQSSGNDATTGSKESSRKHHHHH
ncbi:MAG: HEAT repeat domain-containing protein [Candidatus Kapaibacterium sp.]